MPSIPPAAPEPRDTEEALHIADALMVFQSKRASEPTMKDKKAAIKATRGKLIARKSTPAPIFKRNGWKWLVDSPLPEDKQVWKRIDFGDDPTDSPEAPKCKGELFSAVSRLENEEPHQSRCKEVPLEDEQHSLAIVCYAAASDLDEPCVAVSGAEEVAVVVYQGKTGTPSHSRSMVVEESKSKCTLNGERVYIPEMEGETTHLLESTLERCQIKRSHVSLVVETPSQPKEDNLLLLVIHGFVEGNSK